jgi:hypothetical protein
MRLFFRLVLSVLMLAATAGGMLAQGMPTSQPGILTVIVEELKPGMDAEHGANEAGWPAAFEKVNSPYYYLAIESLTGSPEVWFMSPYASFAAEGENMKHDEGNAALAAEQARLWRADGQYLNATHTFQAVARPDLSYGAFPDLSLVRFYEITTMRVRLGHEQAWEAAAKVYMEQAKRAAPGTSYRVYQITAGTPGANYLIFSTVNAYGEFDKMMADGNAMWQGMNPKDMATLQQTMTEDVQSVITNRYRVSASMSYVAPETAAKDPAFWRR